VLFDKFGKAYIMAGNFNPAFPLWDEIRVITSTDGGESWSAPATALRNTLNPGSSPLSDLAQGRIRQYIDRYWMVLDESNNDIYITAVQTWLQASGPAGPIGPIVRSTDGGRNWSAPVVAAPVGSPFPAAGFGEVATTYADSTGQMIFNLSTDGGQTFTAKPTGFSGGKGHAVADPTTAGRFAVLATNGPALDVYVTTDSGDTWSGPASVVGSLPNDVRSKPWISFSRRGTLGVGWRNTYADNTYDFYAAVSHTGGLSFDPPVKITTTGPSDAQATIWVGGNDTSDLQFGPDDTLYAAWDAWHNGDMDIWWGGFPTTSDGR
jgi:hypothetical protein